MKTLDEVIKALEICKNPDINRNCKDCPMPDTQECMEVLMTDALHYLRQLQLFRETPVMQGIHKAQEEYATYPVEDWNPALTWQELRQMEGKPVWMEERSCRLWIIARNFQRVQYGNIDTEWLRTDIKEIYYDKADIGKTWQAYRKERG